MELDRSLTGRAWSEEMEAYLIKSIRANSFMWNNRDPKYKSRITKNKFYCNLADQLEEKFFINISDVDVQRRWSNMKSYYNLLRSKQLLKNPETTGDETEDAYTPNWPHFQSLEFLNSLEMPIISKTNVKRESFSNNLKQNDVKPFENGSEIEAISSDDTNKTETNFSNKKIKISNSDNNEVYENFFQQANQLMSNYSQKSLYTTEEYYGSYIAQQMSKLTPQLREKTRMSINQILYDALMQHYDS